MEETTHSVISCQRQAVTSIRPAFWKFKKKVGQFWAHSAAHLGHLHSRNGFGTYVAQFFHALPIILSYSHSHSPNLSRLRTFAVLPGSLLPSLSSLLALALALSLYSSLALFLSHSVSVLSIV